MIAVAVSCLPVFFIGGRIERWEGGLYLSYYVAFVLYLILEAGHHEALPAFDAAMAFFVLPLTVIIYIMLIARRARNKHFRRALPERRHEASLGVLDSWNKAIANPRVGQNVPRLCRIRLNLLAQVTNEDPKILGLVGIISSPNVREQCSMG